MRPVAYRYDLLYPFTATETTLLHVLVVVPGDLPLIREKGWHALRTRRTELTLSLNQPHPLNQCLALVPFASYIVRFNHRVE